MGAESQPNLEHALPPPPLGGSFVTRGLKKTAIATPDWVVSASRVPIQRHHRTVRVGEPR